VSTELDPVIHSPVRLRLLGLLNAVDTLEFGLARDELGVSDSTLSQAAAALEQAGYLRPTKRRVGRSTKTWLSLTDDGLVALRAYVAAIHEITGL
jgi:DNA-binding transcriptional ArsR family regulator